MSLRGRLSRWKSPHAESAAGRIPFTLLLGASLALAAAGGILGLRGAGSSHGGLLVMVAKGGTDSAAPGAAERSYVAFSPSPREPLRNLTEDFFSVSSSSVSHDGRWFLFAGRQTPSETPAIWERGTDGSRLRKVTEGNGAPGDPSYLADGRILYSDRPGAGTADEGRSLFSCAPDGSDVRRLTFGEQRDVRPRLLPDGRVRFQRQVLDPPGFTAPLDLVIHPDGTGLSAWVESPAVADAPPEPPPVKAPEGDRVLSVTETAPRPAPPVLTSVIRTEWKTGTLLCLNVYQSRIPAVADLPPGSIRRVRITTRNPAGETLAGEAPVMSDGSFFVEVPADTPLQIHLLGEEGNVLASFQSGIWVRANENHGCIGCHEAPETAPENRQPLAVQRQPASLLLALTRKGGSGGR